MLIGMESKSRILLVWLLSGLLVLIALTGVAGLAIMSRIRAGETALRNRYPEIALERIRSGIFLSSTLARDYFADPSDVAAPALIARLRQLQKESRATLNGTESVAKLRGNVIAYWKVLDLMVEMAARRHSAPVEAYFRHELTQRREAMLQIAREINDALEAEYKSRARELGAMYAQFFGMMAVELVLTLVAGTAISATAIRRLTALEGETRGLSARLVQAQEQERRSIARELHDEVGQSLTALLLEVGAAGALSGEGAVRSRLDSIAADAERIVEEVRRIALSLRPSMLDDLGLVPALEWQAREVGQRSGLAVEVVAEESAGQLPEAHRTCIYRVTQEALQNSVRHAGASKVRIGLKRCERTVSLQVEDDGKGFVAGRMRGLGLLGMEERVAQLGGHLRVMSGERGTQVMAELPL